MWQNIHILAETQPSTPGVAHTDAQHASRFATNSRSTTAEALLGHGRHAPTAKHAITSPQKGHSTPQSNNPHARPVPPTSNLDTYVPPARSADPDPPLQAQIGRAHV